MARLLTKLFPWAIRFFLCIVFLHTHPLWAENNTSKNLLLTDQKQPLEELILDVFVNDKKTGDVILVLNKNDTLYVPEDRLKAWRLKPNIFSETLRYQEHVFYALKTAGIDYKVDMSLLSLHLSIPPHLLEENIIDASNYSSLKAPPQGETGGFLNYDLTSTYQDSQTYNLSTLPEFGVFTDYGVGLNTFLVSKDYDTSKAIRLETRLVRDFPLKMQRLVLGDTQTRGAEWGGAVRLGGIQWSTNFETQPEFVTFPLLTYKSTAALPSVVDVFVNNASRLSQKIDQGPVRIDNIPIVTGQGTATVVTRDLLGRETVLLLPYNTSIKLLKPDLEDFSIEAGLDRQTFGTKSNDYNSLTSVATYNRGLTDTWTLGGHTELKTYQQNLGLTNHFALGDYGILSCSGAGSYDKDSRKNGSLASVSFQQQLNDFNYSVHSAYTTEFFRHIGLEKTQKAPKKEYQLFAGYSMNDYGSLGASFTYQYRRTEYWHHHNNLSKKGNRYVIFISQCLKNFNPGKKHPGLRIP